MNEKLRIPLRELTFTFSRSRGPGGQNVNKVNSRATLSWRIRSSPSLPEDVRARFIQRFGTRVNKEGVLQLHSDRFRDQGRNVADCLERLRSMLESVAVPPRSRRPTRPTRAGRERRLTHKRRQSEKKARRRNVRLD